MNRKIMVLPAVAGLLAPLLAACGGTGGTGHSGAPVVVGATDQFVMTDDTPAPFDPALAYETSAWNILRNTFQSLMALPRSGGEPVPDAASQCRFTDSRSEQFRCTLRKGMKFANGHSLTSEDVKFSIDRTLRIKNPNGPSSLLSGIDTVETPSDTVVVFHLKKPDATFPHKLATPAAAIVDSEVYDGKSLREGFEIDGSGPYQVDIKEQNGRVQSAVFTRNPHYKGHLRVKNDQVEMRFMADGNALEKALRTGGIDLMTRLSPEQIARLEKGDDNIELTEMPSQEIRYLVFDTEGPSVGSKAVRQAIAQTIDRQAIVRDVYKRTVEPLYSLVPSSVSAHLNSFFNKYGEPDPASARRTLRDAGVTTPVKIKLNYTLDHYGPATAEEFEGIKEQLNDTGLFDVDVQGADWEKFRPAQSQGKYEVYGMGWFPDFPDADNFIAPFLVKENVLGSPYHNTLISDTLIPQTRQATQRTAAVEYFERIQNIVADDVPVLPVWQGKQYVAARDDVTGVEWALNSSSVLQLWELGRVR
ncbi:ABC transporter substrate-binding protein [Streptomyces sp. TP-A0874]|uniref:ABC transporter substrate-binding protein n=1 Tax=Streptomyces sp. TP-A0874 TaxID=549819 RepID=UPI000852B688|nr:ABC transporter substrate-binding protein [Streptomyces sp. TP-A0874]